MLRQLECKWAECSTCVLRKSAIRNMSFKMPSRLAMQQESEMPIVRPRFLGCEMRAKMIPIVMESRNKPSRVWMVMKTVAHQQSFGPELP